MSNFSNQALLPKGAACPICEASQNEQTLYEMVQGIQYFECKQCDCLYADLDALRGDGSREFVYSNDYWQSEMSAARSRSFGSSLARCAEVFFYSRIPIRSFLDVGSGPGYLLDALSSLMPNFREMFHGVELFPPPPEFRSTHPNFHVGSLDDVSVRFDGGVCIEVIEHLTPVQLRSLVSSLSRISNVGATYFFNSAQPSFVKSTDPGYLDPFGRGHIIAYSIAGVRKIFSEFGFNVIPLPGRDWAFLAEFTSDTKTFTAEQLLHRLWSPVPENMDKLKVNGFGELMYTVGLESARCYLESAIATERTNWALSLKNMVRSITN
jgi:hypothetical protein